MIGVRYALAFVAASAFSAVVVGGCGGSSGVDTFSLGPSDSDAATTDATSGGDSAGGNGGSDSGTTQDAAQLPQGAIAADGGTNPEAGPGGNTTQLPCGNATCAIPGETCCVTRQNNSPATYACVVGSTCPAPTTGTDPAVALQCSSAANCPASTVCCVEQQNGKTTSSCLTACPNNAAQLCDPNATTTGCAQNQPCSNNNIGDWGLPRTFATCGGVGN